MTDTHGDDSLRPAGITDGNNSRHAISSRRPVLTSRTLRHPPRYAEINGRDTCVSDTEYDGTRASVHIRATVVAACKVSCTGSRTAEAAAIPGNSRTASLPNKKDELGHRAGDFVGFVLIVRTSTALSTSSASPPVPPPPPPPILTPTPPMTALTSAPELRPIPSLPSPPPRTASPKTSLKPTPTPTLTPPPWHPCRCRPQRH